jgi:hypothetical protein
MRAPIQQFGYLQAMRTCRAKLRYFYRDGQVRAKLRYFDWDGQVHLAKGKTGEQQGDP